MNEVQKAATIYDFAGHFVLVVCYAVLMHMFTYLMMFGLIIEIMYFLSASAFLNKCVEGFESEEAKEASKRKVDIFGALGIRTLFCLAVICLTIEGLKYYGF
jgi:uncharacterized membrane protein